MMIALIRRELLFVLRRFMSEDFYTKQYIRILRKLGVDIEEFQTCGFIAPSVYFDGYDRSMIHIGRNAYLTHDVILLVHDQSSVTAYNAMRENEEKPNSGTLYSPEDIYIGDNVFIGMRSIILPGAIIGNNVVVGAGSVVKGVLPPNMVYAGSPAKSISTIENYYSKLKHEGKLTSRKPIPFI